MPTDRAPLNLDTLTLKRGGHSATSGEMCIMEAVAYVAGEPWSDTPSCASPVLSAFLRNLNDTMDEAERQALKPLIPKLIGTNTGAADEQTRGLMAADWLIRVYTPTWLELAGLGDHANALRSAAELKSWDDVVAVTPSLIVARERAAAAWDAARAAARDAAGDAARDAAWAAAWDAARAAARAAARDAAWAAAWAAAWDAAWDAARAAARDAAWAAARDAAWAAARAAARDAAWAAAWAAARDALAPTVNNLRASAVQLAERMAAVGR